MTYISVHNFIICEHNLLVVFLIHNSVHMPQVIPRKMAICVNQYFLCTLMKNVVYTDDHHDFL